ncbi:hypothetical protein AGMMS50267_14850 [Spirochaetia bacterium]|nr:hypothetical protein AGMMS50267_14850 [Spirochaetia bacterium]
MKGKSFLLFALIVVVTLSGCYTEDVAFFEIRTRIFKTNVIGICGEASAEPYIEIQYSVADDNNIGHNKTESIMVSPPYIFQNEQVCAKYEYRDHNVVRGAYVGYSTDLLHDYGEGGAEYLRIINHSSDKPVEFFFAGAQDLPKLPMTAKEQKRMSLEFPVSIPSVQYKRAPLYYLLFPERRPQYDVYDISFTGNQCGDIILTNPWTVEDITALYRAEYEGSSSVKLFVDYNDGNEQDRIRNAVDGIDGWDAYKGRIFYGVIEPGEQLAGDDKIWLLATPLMFNDSYFVRYEQ